MTTPNLPPIATKISETIWELRAAALKGETTEQQLAIGRVADTLGAALDQIRYIADPEWSKHD